MANKTPLNKNSMYVQSLVDFLLDTKPYHSKLTEIVEEYRFFDDVNVKIEERLTSKTKINSANLFNYFSAANPLYRTMPAKRMLSPSFSTEAYTAGLDENTDLASVPFVYSKKSFEGDGVSGVFVQHDGTVHRMLEGIDYFNSQGSFQFQIKQTKNANGVVDPLWSLTQDDAVIGHAREISRELALDKNNPSSATNRIRALLDEIQMAVLKIGGHADVQRELTGYTVYSPDLTPNPESLYGILDNGSLPRSYENLLAWLGIPNEDNVTVEFDEPHDRQWFEEQFSSHSSPLFFGMFSDMGVRESGRLDYPTVIQNSYLKITNIKANNSADVEEWTLTAQSNGTYVLTGSTVGFAGFVIPGQPFSSFRISFNTELLAPAAVGSILQLTPTRKLVIGQDAPLETWNIIKTGPLAYSRPILTSSRFGHLKDLNGNIGKISITDRSFAESDVTITARGDGYFDVVGDTNLGVASEGVLFNENGLAFTIVQGSIPFSKGDRFYFSVQNASPLVENVDLGFGYDFDPYDGDDSLANDGSLLDFKYDGRFTDYDLTQLNIQVTQSAVNGRKWRARAHRVGGEKLLKTIPGRLGNMFVYQANVFLVESSDDDFKTIISTSTVPIGTRLVTSPEVSFSIMPASKPFVVVSAAADDALGIAFGGDVFSFEVRNPEPAVTEDYIDLSMPRIPQLVMRSDEFFNAKEANWTVEFISSSAYKISAVQNGAPLFEQKTISLADGMSFKEFGVHFTVSPGVGLAEGDTFTFKTFAKKPSYLVHGSVTGWTKPALIGEYYWNGKIGFKIKPSKAITFVDDEKTDLPIGILLREDAPALIYSFTKAEGGHIMVRSDVGLPTFVPINEPYVDQYITINVGTATPYDEFKVVIETHDFILWNSPDVVILKSPTKARLPRKGDLIFVEKTEESKFALNMVQGAVSLEKLGPITIDQRFIGTNTLGTPLAYTSPETALIQGWIPLKVEKFDATSPAIFSDTASRYLFKSSITNQKIGELKQQDSKNPNEPIVFEWDLDFFNKYLTLNAEANLIITETGWNDKVKTRITESVKFLIGGGALLEDWLFSDKFNAKITEDHGFKIQSTVTDEMTVDIEDGPFEGFLPGYDNLPYQHETLSGMLNDPETGGSYDAGQPPDIYSLLSNSSPENRAIVLDRWNNFLLDENVPTTEEQWSFLRNALAGDPSLNITRAQDFGVPRLGMAMDITDSSVTKTSAKIQDYFVSASTSISNLYDNLEYDTEPLDSIGETTAVTFAGAIPIQPTIVPRDATYESLDVPISLPVGAMKHVQRTAASTWLVPTRLKGDVKELTVVDNNGATLTPMNVATIDDVISITFAEPVAGKATIMIQTAARVFEIAVTAVDDTPEAKANLAQYSPRFSVWMPNEPAPIQIQVVERFERESPLGQLVESQLPVNGKVHALPSRLFRFSFARPTAGKIIVG